jgi:predicted metal-dependent enzyme (double-stranded beta helix superfamily)
MQNDSLDTFIAGVRHAWGPLSTAVVDACRHEAQQLLRATPAETWLADLHATGPANQELYRDPQHGFVLLAHTEYAGLYRPPHDHGRAWVMYAVQRGEVEMRTFARIETDDGVRLVQRDSTIMKPGQVQVYLPGDIHDTRCLSDTALLFRFTERDLKVEDRLEHRVTRYVDRGGSWIPAAA